jgi:hypothetical protein
MSTPAKFMSPYGTQSLSNVLQYEDSGALSKVELIQARKDIDFAQRGFPCCTSLYKKDNDITILKKIRSPVNKRFSSLIFLAVPKKNERVHLLENLSNDQSNFIGFRSGDKLTLMVKFNSLKLYESLQSPYQNLVVFNPEGYLPWMFWHINHASNLILILTDRVREDVLNDYLDIASVVIDCNDFVGHCDLYKINRYVQCDSQALEFVLSEIILDLGKKEKNLLIPSYRGFNYFPDIEIYNRKNIDGLIVLDEPFLIDGNTSFEYMLRKNQKKIKSILLREEISLKYKDLVYVSNRKDEPVGLLLKTLRDGVRYEVIY